MCKNVFLNYTLLRKHIISQKTKFINPIKYNRKNLFFSDLFRTYITVSFIFAAFKFIPKSHLKINIRLIKIYFHCIVINLI